MKLESWSDAYLIIAILVPGFVYNAVILKFVPLRLNNQKEFALLRFVASTCFIFASFSWFIYLVQFNVIFGTNSLGKAICWFIIVFVWPVVVALGHVKLIQADGLRWLYIRLGLRAIGPIPTAWDVVFGRPVERFVIVTLIDRTEIAGYFGRNSVASSDLDHKDIYLERVYRASPEGGEWAEVERSAGMYIDGAQVAYIEFRYVQ